MRDPRGALVFALLWLMARLPLGVCRMIGVLIGEVSWRLDTRAAKVTNANLQLCFPDMSNVDRRALARKSLRCTGETMMETPGVWLSDRTVNLVREVDGDPLLRKALAETDRGLILLLPHLGNWEMISAFAASVGGMTALYQPPRQAFLAPLMAGVRGRYGNAYVPTTRSGVRRLFRCLEAGETITILPDQVPESGIFVPFFGVEALTDPLIGRLVARTAARVLCVYFVRVPGGFRFCIREPDSGVYSADAATAARGINHTVEQCVLEVPEQYQWEYKRFRERPAGKRKVYRFRGPYEVH